MLYIIIVAKVFCVTCQKKGSVGWIKMVVRYKCVIYQKSKLCLGLLLIKKLGASKLLIMLAIVEKERKKLNQYKYLAYDSLTHNNNVE